MPKHIERRRFKWNKDFDALLTKFQGELGRRWALIASRIEINMRNNPQFSLVRIYPDAKQCRERWMSQLDPSVSRVPFTPEQIDFIMQKVAEGIGYNRIGQILNHPENQVKNTYYCNVTRRFNAYIKIAAVNPSSESDEMMEGSEPDSPESVTIFHVSSSPDLKAKDSDSDEESHEPEQMSNQSVEDYFFEHKPEERELYLPYSWAELQANSFFRAPRSWVEDDADLRSLLELR